MMFAATTVDIGVFIVASMICLVGALGVVISKNPVHSALMLVATLFGVAVHFVALGAHFLAAVQVIVYAGAIVVLFLFVIMLLGVDRDEDIWAPDPIPLQRLLAIAVAAIIGLQVILLAGKQLAEENVRVSGERAVDPNAYQNIRQVAHDLFVENVLAFETTSILLVVAVVGAVVLARRPAGRSELIDLTDYEESVDKRSGEEQSGEQHDGPAVDERHPSGEELAK